jgi:hypothetical protein
MTRVTTPQKRQKIREAIESGMKLMDIRGLLRTSAGTITEIKREMGLPIRSKKSNSAGKVIHVVALEPPTLLPPEAYVKAFEARVIEYHTMLKQKDAENERLQKENAQLRADYQQVVFQAANWTGPTSLMGKSLGNGG